MSCPRLELDPFAIVDSLCPVVVVVPSSLTVSVSENKGSDREYSARGDDLNRFWEGVGKVGGGEGRFREEVSGGSWSLSRRHEEIRIEIP